MTADSYDAERPIFVAGYPGDVGGANTECWHTVKLWRRFGLNVTFIPTWRPNARWQDRLERIGCHTVHTTADDLHHVPGLRGCVVVSFCNANFLTAADRFRELGCRIVWLGCMLWPFPEEGKHYQRHGPFAAYVFQSQYQQNQLQPRLEELGVAHEQCHQIHGAVCCDDFPFNPLPHEADTPFVVGRISRPHVDKYAANTWSIYARIASPIRARVMAWNRRLQRKLGPPPKWARCLKTNAESSRQFLGKLHCMVQINGGAGENWPRSGLEAMAGGVPIVAQNQWGWREMIRHGETGYLADNDDDIVSYASRLAADEELRRAMAQRARRALEEDLANPELLWAAWRRLFAALA